MVSRICFRQNGKINGFAKTVVIKNECETFIHLHLLATLSVFSTDDKKNHLPPDFDIDMESPETERAAVAIQSQFRKYQKKKQGAKS